jgi:hypothetical protein
MNVMKVGRIVTMSTAGDEVSVQRSDPEGIETYAILPTTYEFNKNFIRDSAAYHRSKKSARKNKLLGQKNNQ